MSRYIKAELALNHTIIYTDEDGRYFRFSGGTWTWRNHNPGNLFPGNVSARHNQIGRAQISKTQCFAIFPDYENGHAALLDCLQSTYGEKSIDYLVAKFAPAKDGNNVKVYTKFLHDKTGVIDDKKVKDLTPDEFDKLWHAIEKMEGNQEGTIVEVFPVIQVHKDKTGIYNLNVQTKGWATKEECITLTKQGELDLIICRSPHGNEYLRARASSSVNSSLDKLVVKDQNKNLNKEHVPQKNNEEKMDVVY
jgi:hypothetical protein